MKRILFVFLALLLFAFDGQSQEITAEEKAAIKRNISVIGPDSMFWKSQEIILTSVVRRETGTGKQADAQAVRIALEALIQLEVHMSDDGEYYFWRAEALRFLGAPEQAIITYSRAIEISPKKWPYFRERALCKMEIGNHYGAIPDFTKAMALHAEDAGLYANRGRCYLITEQYDKALLDVNKSISINSKNSFNYITRGMLHIIAKRTKEGCLDLTTAGDLGDEEAFELLREHCSVK